MSPPSVAVGSSATLSADEDGDCSFSIVMLCLQDLSVGVLGLGVGARLDCVFVVFIHLYIILPTLRV